MTKTRMVTNQVLEMVADGILSWETVAMAALSYMSEADVADMAELNEFFPYDGDEEEEE
jgi:hypothetical protein